MTSSPSGPPSSAIARLEGRRDRESGDRVAADVRQVGEDQVVAVDHDRAAAGPPRGSRGGRPPRDRPRSRGRGRAPRPRRRWRGRSPRPSARRRRRATTSAIAIAPLPVPTSTMRTGGEPGGRAADGQPPHDLGLGELDEALGLRARDERAAIDREGQAVELLDARGCRRRARRPHGGRGSPDTSPPGRRRPAPRGGRARPSGRPRWRARAAAPRRGAGTRTRRRDSRATPSRSSAPTVLIGTSVRSRLRSQPDGDADVADLAQDLRAGRAAPAMEQQVDRRLADAQVRQRHLARASPAGAGGAAPARARSACGRRPEHRREEQERRRRRPRLRRAGDRVRHGELARRRGRSRRRAPGRR